MLHFPSLGYVGFMRCLILLLSLTAIAAAQTPKILRSEFIFDPNPVPSCHASTIAEAADHTLVAAWFAGTAEKDPDVGIWSARMVDGKWTKPVEVATGVQPDGKRFAVLESRVVSASEGRTNVVLQGRSIALHLVGTAAPQQ